MMAVVIYLLLMMYGSSFADDSCPGLPLCFCNKEKTSVNCEGKHMTSVPSNIPTTVEKLFLGHNLISNIYTADFGNFSRLEKLSLQNNKISVIEPFAFGNLSSLTELDLLNNKLVELAKDSFSGMKNLGTLYLTNNQIERVHEEAFVGTEKLTYLSMQANRLTSIPALGYMPNLVRVIFQGNQITNATFPAVFNRSKKLSSVVLSSNQIETLGNETFEALRNNSISSLYLSINKLTAVETGAFTPLGSISSLKLGTNPMDASALMSAIASLKGKNMVSLDISGIQLNGVLLQDTFALLKNTSITTLNMRFNKLPTLPNKAFSGLDKLLHLDLSNCEIQQTSPESFAGLDKLSVLILNKNKLMDVPKNIPSSLTSLYLDDNQITAIHDKAFNNLVYLQEVRIRYNKIQTLEQDAFLGLVQLAKLSLYDNYIAVLPGKVFEPLVRLVSLDLEKNNLASIQDAKGRFSALGSLQYLNLADNSMTYFQPDLFRGTTSLQYLHLEKNHLGDMISRDYGGSWLKGLTKLKSLYLMDNKIRTIPDPTFQDLSGLTLLNLTNNKLTGWGPNLFKSTQNLRDLDLTNNLISTLKASNMADLGSLKNLNLTGNPFACNCDLRWFRDWMNNNHTLLANSALYRCAGPDRWAGTPLLSFDRTKINCLFFTWWEILIACSVGVLIVLIPATLAYRKRWWIKLSWYKMTRSSRQRKLAAADGRGDYGTFDNVEDRVGWFDAYISCAEEDKTWVLNHLLPGVDRGKKPHEDSMFGGKYSLYFEDRDSEAGRSIAGNIFENMGLSRKVIVVLSQYYLNSSMHRFELDLATDLVYKEKIEEIVIVHIGGKGLPDKKIPKHLVHTLKRNKAVDWSEEPDAQEHFTHKINDILAKHVVAADQDAE